MIEDTASLFTVDDVVATTKSSNFNKELKQNCFEGNMLNSSADLSEKIMAEDTEYLSERRKLVAL